MTAPWPIKRFEKGITDNIIDAPPGYSEKMHNFFLNQIGKPYQRPGLGPLNNYPQIPAGLQQIDAVYFFDGTHFVKSGTKLYYLDEDDGDIAWTTLAGPSHDAFPNSAVGAKCTFSEWRGHLIITPGPITGKKGGQSTVKVYRDSSNVWTLIQAGLPRAEDATVGGLGVSMSYSVGAVNYAYTWYICFYNSYTAKVNGVDTTFEDYSSPRLETDAGDVMGDSNKTMGNYSYTNSSIENYPTSTMKMCVFRTKANGTVPYYVMEEDMSVDITDTLYDSQLGAEGYQGLVEGNWNDPPPLAYFHTSVKASAWYFGGVDPDSESLYPNRVWKGKPNKFDGVPSGNFVDLEGDVGTAIDHAGAYPVAFFRNKCFRLEGDFDASGGGAVRAVVISNTEGAVSQDTCRTTNGIYFMSANGFCFTDGYKVYNLSEHFKYRFSLLQDMEEASIAYDAINNRVFFGVQDLDLSDVDGNNTAYVMDERFSSQEAGSFTTMGADDDFQPTAMHYDAKNRRMIFGDAQGFLFILDEDNTYDYQVDGSLFTTVTTTKAIVYDYISTAFSFGDEIATKWVTELYGIFKNLTGKLSIDAWSHNDDKSTSAPFGPIRERKTFGSGMHRIMRMFPKGHIACTYKQVQIKKGLVNLFRSDDYEVANVSVVGFTGTATLGQDWPDGDDGSNLVGYSIYFDTDDYDVGYIILAKSGHNITLDNDGATLAPDASAKWIIRGYPKDETIEMHSLAMTYDILKEGDSVVAMGTDTGSNA